MLARFRLFNPSAYGRTGYLTVDWEKIRGGIRIDPENLVVRDEAQHQLPCQIDPIIFGRASLSFILADALPPVGRDDYDYDHPAAYATLESGNAGEWREPETPKPDAGEARDDTGKLLGVKLRNGLLDVWINLVPAPWEPERDWFSGSATSVVVSRGETRHEILDAYDWFHAAEKRLQLDRLWLPHAVGNGGDRREIPLFNQPYELVSRSDGPVRATVTLASSSFEYSYTNPGSSQEQTLICRLFRVLSLYRGADHLVEELFVRGSLDGNPVGAHAVDLTFVAHYFSYMRMRGGLSVSRFEQIPGWFAITSRRLAVARKFHCYGFAADVHANLVEQPYPFYPMPDEAENTFSWSLQPCTAAKCLHLFTFWHAEDQHWSGGADFWSSEEELAKVAQRESESRAGKAWYEFIYKPLIARP